MQDELSTYYADFLAGTYECVDRIVLNAYFRLGQTPGGFRTWWRKWKGSDDDLDNADLMRMAGRLIRRRPTGSSRRHLVHAVGIELSRINYLILSEQFISGLTAGALKG